MFKQLELLFLMLTLVVSKEYGSGDLHENKYKSCNIKFLHLKK